MADRDLLIRGISKSFPGSGLVLDDVDLTVPEGSSLALLGPSGCGKTTLLRIIAGLERPDTGSVYLGERMLVDGQRSLPPEKRRIGMVFQNWALFSHLSVARNVGFGLSRPERRISQRIDDALGMVGMSQFADRSTDTLSGGQQQRVALARALAPRPEVLVLDEPFSNLDATLRASVRSEVRALLRGMEVTSIFVTHDQEEAFILGDRIAVMNEGRIVEVGTPVDVYERPVDRWVATFVGEANFVRVETGSVETGREVTGPAVTGPDGDAGVATVETPFGTVEVDPPALGGVDLLVRPERFTLVPAAGSTDDRDARGRTGPMATATVTTYEYLGPTTRYVLDWQGHKLVALEASRPRFAAGDPVGVCLSGGPFRAFAVD